MTRARPPAIKGGEYVQAALTRPDSTPGRILRAIAEYDGMPLTARQIADHLGMKPSTVMTRLTPLTAAGLVDRHPDPDDAHQHLYRLSRHARAA